MSTPNPTSEVGLRFDSLQQEAYLSLWRTYDRLKMLEDDLFSQHDLTAQQYNLLRLLELANPDSVPTLVLAGRLVSRAPDITRMLDKLEKQGWIARNRSTQDRREVRVSITEAGLEKTTQLAPLIHDCHLSQIGHLAPEELEQLCLTLRKVRHPHEPPGSRW